MADTTKKPPMIRWIAVVLCVIYGFAKVNGSQFTVLDSELSKPLGQVSGFWLTWYYFSFSPVYGSLIAFIQIGCAILLAWPRTALLAALLLLPVMVNILLVDIFFGIGLGPTLVVIIILGCLAAVIAPHAARLRTAILLQAPDTGSALRATVMVAVLVGSCGFTWWIANFNNRHPTTIDGIWQVVSASEGGQPGPVWRQVFFERNRAFWVTFRSVDGTDELHHFEMDGHGGIRIWRTWLRKGPLIMQGRLGDDGRIELDTVDNEKSRRIILRRQGVSTN